MQLEIITMYAVSANFLQAMGEVDDPQGDMTTAEIMTTAWVAARFFGRCLERSRHFLKEHHYIPRTLAPPQSPLAAIPEAVWQGLLATQAAAHHTLNVRNEYIVDRFPVAVCDNICIRRCRWYRGAAYRGYCASKRRYVYGLRAHVVVTATGVPGEVVLAPASYSDGRIGKPLHLDLPMGAVVFADAAYTDYGQEDAIAETHQLRLQVARKSNSKRSHAPSVRYLAELARKRVETTFSQITDLLAHHIYAGTTRGFELKIFLFILAFAICC